MFNITICFSLRTLCRALIEANHGCYGSDLRSLYEVSYIINLILININ